MYKSREKYLAHLSKYNRERYNKRKEEGVCVMCGAPRDNETLKCSKCREKQTVRNREDKSFRREKGLCMCCGKQKPVQGKLNCMDCLFLFKEYGAKRIRKKPTEEDKQASAERHRALYAKRRAEGLCVRCGKPIYTNHNTTMYCYEHYIAYKRNNLARIIYNRSKKYMDIGEQT